MYLSKCINIKNYSLDFQVIENIKVLLVLSVCTVFLGCSASCREQVRETLSVCDSGYLN